MSATVFRLLRFLREILPGKGQPTTRGSPAVLRSRVRGTTASALGAPKHHRTRGARSFPGNATSPRRHTSRRCAARPRAATERVACFPLSKENATYCVENTRCCQGTFFVSRLTASLAASSSAASPALFGPSLRLLAAPLARLLPVPPLLVPSPRTSTPVTVPPSQAGLCRHVK